MTTTTVLDPATLPTAPADDEPLFEIIDGHKVELPPMSAYAGRIASRLSHRLNDFGERQNFGEAVTEVIFHLPLPVDRNRRPDVAFVSYTRWPKGQSQPRSDNAWKVVPDLGVEVVSPHDLAEDLLEKIAEYFQAGVSLVWVIYPRRCLVHVYDSLTTIRVLTAKDDLDGGIALPGFRMPLANLFLEGPELPGESGNGQSGASPIA